MKTPFKQKRFLFLAAFLAIVVPLFAISYGHNLNRTLRVLRNELEADHRQIDKNRDRLTEDYEKQRQKMIDVMKQSDELSLMLYSQKQGFTFDVSYALQKVTEKYNEFNQDRGPFDRIVTNLNVEMERHARLLESLRRLPPELDTIIGIPDSLLIHYDSLNPLFFSNAHLELDEEIKAMADSLSLIPFVLDQQGEDDREQCIFYAGELLKMYAETKAVVVADSIHYYETFLRLKETYDYAHDYYQVLQNRIFVEGQTPWYTILQHPGRYWRQAMEDAHEKYDTASLSSLFKRGQAEQSANKGMEYSLQIYIFVLFVIELIVIWLIVSLLLIPAFRYFKPLKEYVEKDQRRFISLLIAIVITIIINSTIGGDGLLHIAARLTSTFLWLLAAILVALFFRLKPQQLKYGFRLYLPTFCMALAVIGFRVVFMPNALMNFVFPPVVIGFFVWQLFACLHNAKKVDRGDRLLGWVSLVAIGAALGVSIAGYIFASLLILVWWYFQLAAIHIILAILYLILQYRKKRMTHRINDYRSRIDFVTGPGKETLMFGATWFYDLVKDVVLPVMGLLSIPFCIHLALDVFDFEDLYNNIYYKNFVQLVNDSGADTFRMSFHGILLIMPFGSRFAMPSS